MILKSLRLRNIRSYRQAKITFPKGSVLLSGDIGAGKSTILLAIEFALFGIMRAELPGTALLRHGANKGEVTLTFSIGKDEYTIMRTLRRTSTSVGQDSGHILTNGKKFEGTPVELKAKIIEILGYPQELVSRAKSLIFRYTIYTPQEEMKMILLEDKEQRLNTLRKVFGIDKYKSIRENAVIFIRELKRTQSELAVRTEPYDTLKEDFAEKKVSLDKTEQQIAEKKQQAKKKKAEIDNKKEELEKLQEDLEAFTELKKGLSVLQAKVQEKTEQEQNLKKRIEETQERIQSMEKRLEEYADIKKQDADELEKRLAKREEELETLSKAHAEAKATYDATVQQMEQLNRELADKTEQSKKSIVLQSQIEQMKSRLQQKNTQEQLLEKLKDKRTKLSIAIEKTELQINDAKEVIDMVEDAESCPTCSRKMDDAHRKKVLTEHREQIESYTSKKQDNMERKEKVLSNIEKVKSNLRKLAELEKKYRKKREELASLTGQEEIVALQKRINALGEKRDQTKKEMEKAQTDESRSAVKQLREKLSVARNNNMKLREKKNILELLEEKREQSAELGESQKRIAQTLSQLQDSIREKKEALREFEDIDEKKDRKKKKLDALQEEQQEIAVMLAKHQQEKASLNERLSELQQQIEDIERIQKRIETLGSIQQWFEEFFLKLMVTMEKHIMVSIHREFSSLLREWFNILIDDLELTLDEDFSPIISQDGYETNIENLSGGEKTSVALAYRLALNRVINDLIPSIKTKDLIILDEPTDGFSTDQLDKVRDVLRELGMAQTIIVSHEPKLEAYVGNVIRIEKRENVSTILGDSS